jgi:hypothetical protein
MDRIELKHEIIRHGKVISMTVESWQKVNSFFDLLICRNVNI